MDQIVVLGSACCGTALDVGSLIDRLLRQRRSIG